MVAQQFANLEEKILASGGVLPMLRRSPGSHVIFPGIPPEFTNWRDEQNAWHDAVVLFEQSYHMTELHLKGAGSIEFLATLAVNRFDNLTVMRAKQLVMVDDAGHLISDAIVFREAEDFLRIVGPPSASNWVQFQAEKNKVGFEVTRNENMIIPRAHRDVFRFQLQGPNALALLQSIVDDGLPDIKFFHIGEFRIAGQTVRALRHGMAGRPGFEIYGPWDSQQLVRQKVEEAGEEFGLRKAGCSTYPTAAQESGWMPRPFPSIYTGSEMEEFRRWLPAVSFEGTASLGGSFESDDPMDYCVNPFELGYGPMVDFEHEFKGRAALLEKKPEECRKKVTLAWNNEDVFDVMRRSVGADRPRTKFIALPIPMYATFQNDEVTADGRLIGLSQWSSYSSNAGCVLSTALIDPAEAEMGREVILNWGEPNSTRPTVEKNEVAGIRATISPVPFFEKSIKRD